MASSSMPFKDSIRGQLIMFLVLPVLVIIVSLISLNAYNTFENAALQAESSLVSDVKSTALLIEQANQKALQTAKIMALAQQEGLFGRRLESSQYARQVLATSPELNGAYFGYEPNADGQDSQTIQPGLKNAVNTTGRFLPYWYRQGDSLAVSALLDMETSLYYDGVRQLFNRNGNPTGLVTEPYEYEGVMLVEQSYPIVINGKFVGVAGVDMALDKIEQMLMSLKQQSGYEMFLVSRQNTFIASTTRASQLKTKLVSDTPYAKTLAGMLSNRDKGYIDLLADPFDEGQYYYASYPVATGDWVLILRESEETVKGPIVTLTIKGAVLAAVGLLLIVVIAFWFARRISIKVESAVKIADNVAQGNVSALKTKRSSERDEIDLLTMRLYDVVDSYQEISRVCKAVADGDLSVSMPQRSANDVVAIALNEMSAKRKEMEDALHERTKKILDTTTTQGREIESVAVAMDEMTQTVGEISRLASGSAEDARDVVESVGGVQKTLSGAVDQVKQVSQDIGDISSAVTVVSESTGNINSIIDVINMIAEQTNLLALNAAIEAARAGEQGRGFAVVADEVRTLAGRTRTSTDEISSLINELRANVANAVKLVNEGQQRTQSSVESTEAAFDLLNSVTFKVNAISDHMIHVATAVEEQSKTCEEINRNLTVVNETSTELAEFARRG
ncbi:methyl-accepting chemotaxis protein [Bowmanella yangjiangensis]|uniref:Methyl-accepting chemotaxis protein n=1 Tax=Bowmanella yangjiangensis TaxID=2811230 RepID=A0ABS3CQD9_9ALTE|nr:methyl-accepting chemotaxis protein [Bowmanella yangjiangensis]MBN7818759.1 methyl-accepting chemotaxis protein [Bowmanella yangjiangensis]